MSTPVEYDADLETALIAITGGLRRPSDELRRDRVPTGGNSFQLRQSAEALGTAGSFDGNTLPQQMRTSIVVYHYLDLAPSLELERDYTLGEMLVMQEALLFHGLYIRGFTTAPAHALTTVQDFYNGADGEPVINVTFERVGRVISFSVEVAVNLNL